MLTEVEEGSAAPTGRAAQKQETRERVLAAARRVFAEVGVGAARTVDVAKAAGVSHGTVFVHFPTRDALVAAVVSDCIGGAARRIHARSHDGLDIREVLEAHLEAIAEDEPLYARIVMEAPLLPTEARHALMGIQSAIGSYLGQAYRREREAGRVREVSLPFLFNTWLGLINHYLINRDLFAPGASVVARHGASLVGQLLLLLNE